MSMTIDNFPCGCLVTNSKREIVFANAYMLERFGWPIEKLIGHNIDTLLSPASRIFCDCYVYPLLLNEGGCEETQLTLVTDSGADIPIIANVRRSDDSDSDVYWSLFGVESRDKLYHKLIETRRQLEDQKRQLITISDTDALTGMMNRRAFDRELETVLAHANGTDFPVAVLLLDIDHFKRINDEFGHDVGDQALQTVAACIMENCRSGELAARYGGEEFVFLLSNADNADAIEFSERLQSAIRLLRVKDRDVTVSIGIHSAQITDAISGHYLLKCADSALYKSKNTGRNKTSIYIENDTDNDR